MFSQILDHSSESIAATRFGCFGIDELFGDRNAAVRSVFSQKSKLCRYTESGKPSPDRQLISRGANRLTIPSQLQRKTLACSATCRASKRSPILRFALNFSLCCTMNQQELRKSSEVSGMRSRKRYGRFSRDMRFRSHRPALVSWTLENSKGCSRESKASLIRCARVNERR